MWTESAWFSPFEGVVDAETEKLTAGGSLALLSIKLLVGLAPGRTESDADSKISSPLFSGNNGRFIERIDNYQPDG